MGAVWAPTSMSCITIRFRARQSVNTRRRVARLGPRLEACGRQGTAWLDAGVPPAAWPALCRST
eukprot:5108684-Heterocapsa_arctica.AAC.1